MTRQFCENPRKVVFFTVQSGVRYNKHYDLKVNSVVALNVTRQHEYLCPVNMQSMDVTDKTLKL